MATSKRRVSFPQIDSGGTRWNQAAESLSSHSALAHPLRSARTTFQSECLPLCLVCAHTLWATTSVHMNWAPHRPAPASRTSGVYPLTEQLEDSCGDTSFSSSFPGYHVSLGFSRVSQVRAACGLMDPPLSPVESLFLPGFEQVLFVVSRGRALQLHLCTSQVHAGLRPERLPLLAGTHAGRRRGPAVCGEEAGEVCQ